MSNKSFFLFLFLIIVSQILFSFYYSSEIINQNNLINQNQIILEDLKIKNQKLKNETASLTSINSLYQIILDQNKPYLDLKENINFQN
jgi:hypothetical protein